MVCPVNHLGGYPKPRLTGVRARYGFRKFGMRRHSFVDRGAAYTDEPSESAERISQPHLLFDLLTIFRPIQAMTACGLRIFFRRGHSALLRRARRRPVPLGLDLNEYDLIAFHAARYTPKAARPGSTAKRLSFCPYDLHRPSGPPDFSGQEAVNSAAAWRDQAQLARRSQIDHTSSARRRLANQWGDLPAGGKAEPFSFGLE